MPSADDRVDAAALAHAAGLHLPQEQLEIVAPILTEWRQGCLDLNRKMSDSSRMHLVPVTVLVHGDGHD